MFGQNNIKSVLSSAFDQYREIPIKLAIANNSRIQEFGESSKALIAKSDGHIIPQFSIQKVIRPVYGKSGINQPVIGDHPDFEHLSGTDGEEYAAITTLFMDIAGSTRLGRIRSLPEVKRIKNAFMRAAIEIAQAFDGHVHRLQGDSVMVYFGGKYNTSEQGIIDALNCASVLRYFVDRVVVPGLQNEGFDDPPGIRIGIDFGNAEDVLWSSYGYPGTCEVTATSYYVDVASKLQHSAGKNQIMVGDSLKAMLDLPEGMICQKMVYVDGRMKAEPYVLPNHTDEDGRPFNYRQYIFDWEKYLAFSPIAQIDNDFAVGDKKTGIMRVSANVETGLSGVYAPTSRILDKDQTISFRIELPYMPRLPYTLRFIVENNGHEALTQGGDDCGNHETRIEVRTEHEHKNIVHCEHTAFRGLHYMTVKLSTMAGLEHETRFGVFIE